MSVVHPFAFPLWHTSDIHAFTRRPTQPRSKQANSNVAMLLGLRSTNGTALHTMDAATSLADVGLARDRSKGSLGSRSARSDSRSTQNSLPDLNKAGVTDNAGAASSSRAVPSRAASSRGGTPRTARNVGGGGRTPRSMVVGGGRRFRDTGGGGEVAASSTMRPKDIEEKTRAEIKRESTRLVRRNEVNAVKPPVRRSVSRRRGGGKDKSVPKSGQEGSG